MPKNSPLSQDYLFCLRPVSLSQHPRPPHLRFATPCIPMSQPDQDPENSTEQALATLFPIYQGALHLSRVATSLNLADLNSISRLLILVICLGIFVRCFSIAFLLSSLFCFSIDTWF